MDSLLEYSKTGKVANQEKSAPEQATADPLLAYSKGIVPKPVEQPESKSNFIDQAKQMATDVIKAPVELAKYFINPSSPEAGKSIKPEELEQISQKYNGKISPEELGKFAISMGGTLEGSEHPVIDRLVGVGLEGLGAGLVPFAVKKLKYADNPEARKAVDEIRSIVDERKTKGQVAAELATGLLVPGGLEAKGAKILTPVAYGAAFGLGGSKEGEEGKAALQGGLLGAYLHGLSSVAKAGAKAIRGAEVPKDLSFTTEKSDKIERAIQEKVEQKKVQTPYIEAVIEGTPKEVSIEDVPRILESRPEAASEALSEYLKKVDTTPEEAQRAVAQKLINDEIGEFARYLEESESLEGKKYERADNALSAIQRANETEGPAFIKDAYERFKESKAAEQVFDEGLIEKMPTAEKNVQSIRDFLLNSRYPYRFIDRKLGTNLEASLDKLTKNMNVYSLKVDNVLDNISKLGKQLEEVKLNPNEVPRLIETNQWKSLQEPQRRVVQNIISYQEALRNQANQLGMNIKSKDSYVRHSTVSAPEYISKILEKASESGVNAVEGVTQQEFNRLTKTRPGQELVQALTLGKLESPQNAAELNVLLKESLNPQAVSERINNFASAAQKREGEIPNFVRETNILKLMKNWGENTFRHAYLREPLAEMKTARNRALSAGDKYSAALIGNHLGQILGTKAGNRNLASWTKNQRINFQAKMLKEANQASGLKKSVYKQLAQSPETAQFLMSQVYPNFLGLKPKSALVNLVQPLMLSVPEIGWVKGSGMLLKAYADLAAAKLMGKVIKLSPEMAEKLGKNPGDLIKTRNLQTILQNEGAVPTRSFNHEVERYIKDGISQGTKGLPRQAIEKLNDLAMFLFESSETTNRYVVKTIGEELAREAFKGNTKTLDKMLPPAYKRELKGKTLKEAESLISKYLINKTMFAYNRAELSQFGREFGSLMAQFSKFPSSIGGDIVDIFHSKGAFRGGSEVLRKYLAPTFALGIIGSAGLNQLMEDSPALKKLIGNQGVEDWSALSAVKTLLDRGMAPPHVKNILSSLQSAMTASPQKGWKTFNDVVQSTLPLGWTLRFLGDDLPAYMGEESEKGSFLQKALRGSGVNENSLDEYVNELEQQKQNRQ